MKTNSVFIGSTWSALERRKYAGLIQNKLLDKYNVKTASTSTGEALFVKPAEYDKIKKYIPAVKARGEYIIMINKTLAKKLGV